MSIIIDVFILLAIALSIFLGYKKGLIGVVLKIVSFFIAIILAFILYKPVSNYIIENTLIDDNIQITIENFISSRDIEQIEEGQNIETSMPAVITDYIGKQIKSASQNAQNEIAKVVASNLTVTIVNGISLIGIFLISKFLLVFIKIFANAIADIPILKQFNKVGGFLYGVLRGFFVIYLLFAIISLVSPLISNTEVLYLIDNSILGSIMYNNNLLLKVIFK